MYTLQKTCEVVVRIVWGTCEAVWGTCEVSACVHIWITPSLGQKSLQARRKPNASHASLSCQRYKSFDTWVWILGGGTYVLITKSMWGHCEDSVRNMWSGWRNMWGECEEHVRTVQGTCEDSARNMWVVGNLTTLMLSLIANVMPVSNKNHQTSLIKEWLSDVW